MIVAGGAMALSMQMKPAKQRGGEEEEKNSQRIITQLISQKIVPGDLVYAQYSKELPPFSGFPKSNGHFGCFEGVEQVKYGSQIGEFALKIEGSEFPMQENTKDRLFPYISNIVKLEPGDKLSVRLTDGSEYHGRLVCYSSPTLERPFIYLREIVMNSDEGKLFSIQGVGIKSIEKK